MISALRGSARRIAAAVALMALTAFPAHGQALQLIGMWTLNVAKSSMSGPLPQKQTVTFKTGGVDILSGAEETVYANGGRAAIAYTAKMDGRDYPITGSPEILSATDTISLKRVNAATVVWTYKKGSAVVLTLPGTISADGRVLTMAAPGGQAVLVYERQ